MGSTLQSSAAATAAGASAKPPISVGNSSRGAARPRGRKPKVRIFSRFRICQTAHSLLTTGMLPAWLDATAADLAAWTRPGCLSSLDQVVLMLGEVAVVNTRFAVDGESAEPVLLFEPSDIARILSPEELRGDVGVAYFADCLFERLVPLAIARFTEALANDAVHPQREHAKEMFAEIMRAMNRNALVPRIADAPPAPGEYEPIRDALNAAAVAAARQH